MALTRTTHISATGPAVHGTGPLTTGSFTPSNNSLLVAIAGFQKVAAAGTDPSTSMTISNSGTALTWTSRALIGHTSDYGGGLRIWTAPVTTGASITVSFDCGALQALTFYGSVIEYTGYDTGSPTGATAADTTMAGDGADSITLSGATASTSEVFGARYGGVPTSGTAAAVPDTGHTEIHDLQVTDAGGMQTQVRDTGSTSTSFSWSDVSNGTSATLGDVIGVAVEIKAAATGTDATPTVVAVTFVIPTPAITAPTNVTATAVAQTWTIPTPAVSTGNTDITAADVVATFVIPAPTISVTGVIQKVADRGIRTSTSTGTAAVDLPTAGAILTGNYLIARVSVDNSGTNGALPGLAVTETRSNTWTVGTGALQDPGTASQGIACYLCYAKVSNAYTNGDDITFTWTTGTPISAIVIEEWAGIDQTTPVAVAQATANNVSSTAQPTAARTPSAADQMMYVAAALEGVSSTWGAQDTDTTNGSWVDVTKDQANTGTAATSASVYGGYKIVTASGAQTWNNTLGVTSDWATVGIVYARQTPGAPISGNDVVATFVIPTPAITVPSGTNVTPAAVAQTWTIPTPTITASSTVTVTAVAQTWTIPTPAISGTQVAATVVAQTWTIPTPAITTGVSIAATAVAQTWTIPTPVVTASATVTATAVAQSWTAPTPVVTASATVTAVAVAQTWTIPTPAVTAGTSIAATVVAQTWTIPTPTVTATANIAVTAVAQSWVIPSPSVTTGADTSIGGTAVAQSYTIPTPVISGTQVTATAAVATFVIPTPVIGAPTNIAATRVQMIAAIPTPGTTTAANVTPAAVAMLMAPRTPALTASAQIQVAAVAMVMVIRAVAIGGGISLFGGDATQTLTASGASSTTSTQGATVTFAKVDTATQDLEPQ